MRKSTKLALAFIALAGAVGTAAYADEQCRLAKCARHDADAPSTRRWKKCRRQHQRSNSSPNAMDTRLKKMVADNGGKPDRRAAGRTPWRKERFERMAKRIVARYDAKGDGTLTTDDITGREKKVFAMLDQVTMTARSRRTNCRRRASATNHGWWQRRCGKM